MEKSVAEVMSRDIASVSLNDNIYEIAVIMAQKDTGFVPVVEDGNLIGAVTDRDMVIRGYAEKRSGSASVREVMSDQLITVNPGTSADEAAEIMSREQIRRLPVVDNGKLVGIVSIGDLAVRNTLKSEAGAALSQISEQEQSYAPH
ncbi:CBS domain-containing protein [Gorillibacterium massiliense]|uniref:CBS domain-containing protein n=1 Tax=Gorillibacterium massiliense TaxID=1280390 RepID=UPI0004B434D1|nr:CBS domain-containing protein [Gorillibacterium massiliense]